MSAEDPKAAERAAQLGSLRIERDDPAHGSRSGRWLVAAAVLVVASLAGVWWLHASAPVEVHVALARASGDGTQASSVLDATGYVTARRAATVSSETTGKVRDVLIEEGQAVEEGEVLAYLDDRVPRAELALAESQLDAARAQLAETRAQLVEAEDSLKRIRELAARKLASAQDLDSAKAKAAALEAHLAAGEQNVAVAMRTVDLKHRQLDVYTIRAPFAGVVIDKNAQPGEMISPISAGGGFTRTGICTIVDMQSLEIEVDVNEAYIQRVATGQHVTAVLDAYPDSPLPARVIAIVPSADRERATVRVRIGFVERDPRVLPDMGVKVSFLESASPETPEPTTETRNVSVPRAALKGAGDARYVLVVENGHAARRNVRDVEEQGENARIGSGVAAGERVIVAAPASLVDGDAVDVVE